LQHAQRRVELPGRNLDAIAVGLCVRTGDLVGGDRRGVERDHDLVGLRLAELTPDGRVAAGEQQNDGG
jgi:hypothetical protein